MIFCVVLKKLNLNPDLIESKTKKIGEILKGMEFQTWANLLHKGEGVILFQECHKIDKGLSRGCGLTESEFINYLKMVCDVITFRSLYIRIRDGNQCRRSSITEIYTRETLFHVLGKCPFNGLIRNTRHHAIRKIIAEHFVIIDPTVRTEHSEDQPAEVLCKRRRKRMKHIAKHLIITKENTKFLNLKFTGF